MEEILKNAEFELGQIILSQNIEEFMKNDRNFEEEILDCLRQYSRKNWGKISEDSKFMNQYELEHDGQIMGSYETIEGNIWIETRTSDIGRVTTILFPNEW